MIDPMSDPGRRRVDLAIAASAAAVAWFAGFFTVTTQIRSIRSSLPFTDDPFDLVTSFAVIALMPVMAIAAIRVIRRALVPSLPAGGERRVLVALAIALALVSAPLVSDAMALAGVGWAPGWATAAVAGGSALTLIAWLVVLRAMGAGRRPTSTTPDPDLFDDLAAIGRRLRLPVDGTDRWLATSPLSPRRHRHALVLALTLLAGGGAVIWHSIVEGAWASPAAATVFGVLGGAATLLALVIAVGPLGAIRPATQETVEGYGPPPVG
jgi:hypothetical protein